MELGRGSFGSVQGVGSSAIKSFHSKSGNHLKNLVAEVFVTRYVSLDKPANIIKLKGCNFEQLTMTTQRWHCNLEVALSKGMTLDQKRSVHACILRGLAYLGRMFIVNADIKPSNIFVNKLYTEACIGDFGIGSLSGTARVRQTSPAFALAVDKARNHRSHDLLSFVILTLCMFYNHRIVKVMSSCEEVRALIKALVPLSRMRAVLTALVQDNGADCWTAERALYELYGERLPESPRRLVFYELRDRTLLQVIKENIVVIHTAYRYRKRTRCYNCSVQISAAVGCKSVQECVAYSTVVCYVFSCMFGSVVQLTVPDVLALAHIEKKQFYSCLNSIISEQQLIRLMFAP